MGEFVATASVVIQGQIALAAFSHGRAYRFIFEKIIDEDGVEYDPILGNPVVFGLATSVVTAEEFTSTILSITKEPLILLALSDLNEAIAQPNYALVACGRAADSIRHAIAGVDADPKTVGWPKVKEALNVERSFLEAITSDSTRPRHGERLYGGVSGTDEIVRRSWILMNRLLEYRKRGNIPLADPDFPNLTG